MTKSNIIIAIAASVCATFLVLATYYYDNTTQITANGTYRVKMLEGILQGGRLDYNSSQYINHPLYLNFVALVWQILNLSSWPGTSLTKMAITNSVAAGIALFGLISLVWSITKRLLVTGAITIFYLFSGYFFFLSVSSEDILPAIAFFLVSIWLFSLFTTKAKKSYLWLSGISFSLSFLMHRSLALAYPAFFLGLFTYRFKDQASKILNNSHISIGLLFNRLETLMKDTAMFTLAFIAPVIIFITRPTTIIFSQPSLGGWFGFYPAKIAFTVLAGIGQSLFLGQNLSSLTDVLKPENLFFQAMTIILVASIITKLFQNLSKPQAKYQELTVFLLANFFIAEFVNLLSQGQDPQLQMQPLVIIPLGLALAFVTTPAKFRRLWKELSLALSIMVVTATLLEIQTHKGGDSIKLKYISEVSQAVDFRNTLMFSHGFDLMQSWGRLFLDLPDDNLIGLASYFVYYPDASATKITARLFSDIETALNSGKQVVITDIITSSDEDFAASMATVDPGGKALVLKNSLLQHYNLELFSQTSKGPLFLLTPKKI